MKKILFTLLTTGALLATNGMKAQTVLFEDSFETYTDFAIANVGNWTLTDVDMKTTYGFNGITFLNSGVAKSFQVFNSTTTTPAMTPTATSNWTGKTGNKMMVSFGATSSPWTNDWLISPQVQLVANSGATLSFWGKACDATYGLEKFKVLVSTTGTAVGDFTAISPVIVTPADAAWHEYTYNLNGYAGQQVYVAIQCTSDDQFGFAVDDFKIVTAPLATSAPDCATLSAPANGATNVPYLSQSLSWQAPTSGGAVDSYDVYLDKNPNPTTLVASVSSTSYTASNLDAGSTYYWKVVPKNTIGSASGCSVYSFTTATASYCTAGATSSSFEKISNVTFAGINNNSTATTGYENFTSVSTSVAPGQTYAFSASFTGTSFSSDQVIVWIDLNNDKDFNDEGEQVLTTPTKVSPWTGNITIPANASLGETRMRVRMHDSSIGGNTTPCGTSTYGQVEDYTIAVTLGVSDNAKKALRVYPNPVVDVLNIEGEKLSSVAVYDLSGKAVSTHTLKAVKNQINLSKLTPGAYVVKVETEAGSETVKVIKK